MSSVSEIDPAGAITVTTREGYDRWSAIYDTDNNPLVALDEPEVVRMLGDVRGLRVADVGSGTGRHATRIANAGALVTALDFSPGMIAQARAKPGTDRVRFVMADCTQPLPLNDAAFDRVLCCLLADHAPALEPLIGELARVCRRSGFIVLTTVHPAMHLRGVRARFTDPATGKKVYPASYEFTISDYVNAATHLDLRIEDLRAQFHRRNGRADTARRTVCRMADAAGDAAGARAKIKSGSPGLPDRRLVTSEIRALTCRR